MIREGNQGSVCIYWKDLLIAGFPLGRYHLEDYKNDSNRLIMDSLNHGINIPSQIKSYHFMCESVYKQKKNKNKISTEDLQMFFCSLLCLIRFKMIEEDDVILICQKKKKNSHLIRANF